MCGVRIDSGRSQPSLSSTINGSSMMIPSKKDNSKLRNNNNTNTNTNIKTSKSSPLLATDDDMIKCKYIAKNSQLGDGNFSVVKECINVQTKETYAMKLVHKNLVENKLQLIKREFGLLNALSAEIRHLENKNKSIKVTLDYFQGHHHILQLYDYFETEENIVLITQLCDQSDLYEKIIKNGHLDLMKQVIPYTACLVSVLDFLHSQRVIHRDIKAENVLFRLHKKRNPELNASKKLPEQYDLSAHDLILGDFGLATRINDPNSISLKEYVGTISYIAPEIVKCKSVSSMTDEELSKVEPYGTSVDIWALGVLVYFMAFGYTPFDCETDEETLDCIAKCDYYIDEDYLKRVEYKDFWNFIQCCFVIDPKKRRTSKQLRHHPFIEKFFDNRHSTSTTGTSLLVERPDLGPRNHSFNTLRKLESPERTESLMNSSWVSSSGSSSVSTGDSITSTLSTRGSNYSYGMLAQNNNRHDQGLIHDPSFVNIATRNPGADAPKRTPSNKTIKTDSNNVKKPMIRRTISMTSVKNSPSSYKVNKINNASIIASHSTFFLDPQPPKGSLMNGRFSENPQQLSNFDSTPRTLSRDNSSKSLFSLLSHDDTDKDNLVNESDKVHGINKWHDENENFQQMEGGTVTFELGSSDEDNE